MKLLGLKYMTSWRNLTLVQKSESWEQMLCLKCMRVISFVLNSTYFIFKKSTFLLWNIHTEPCPKQRGRGHKTKVCLIINRIICVVPIHTETVQTAKMQAVFLGTILSQKVRETVRTVSNSWLQFVNRTSVGTDVDFPVGELRSDHRQDRPRFGGSHTGVLRGDETSYVWLVLLRFRKGIAIMGRNRQSWKNTAKC